MDRPHTQDFEDRPARRRATREGLAATRAALALVLPVHKQIGPWQASAARLVGIGERLKAHGLTSPTHAAEVEALLSAVEAQRALLRAQSDAASSGVARNGRMIDTERALASVAATLTTAGRLLGARLPPH